jgi:hypothetical protein
LVCPEAFLERAVDCVGHRPGLWCALGGLGLAKAVALLVNVEHLAVRIEARSAELRVVRNRLSEVVDLAILRDATDELRAWAVLAEKDVLGARDDGDVVRVFECGALERDV